MSDNIERPCTGVRDCGGEGVDWDVKPEIIQGTQGGAAGFINVVPLA